MPVSPSLLGVIRVHKHEGVHAGQIGKAFAPDEELLEPARQEGRVIVTADLDFPRLPALSLSVGPGVILFRGSNYSDVEMCDLLERVFKEVSPETLQNSICVVDQRRIRVTRLPISRKS